MALPNQSEKSVALDREENLTKGNVAAKRVAIYNYNSNTDTIEPGIGGFSPNSDITTEITGDVITQTDGVKTLTITISGSTITEAWS